jgi:hypothetical protein
LVSSLLPKRRIQLLFIPLNPTPGTDKFRELIKLRMASYSALGRIRKIILFNNAKKKITPEALANYARFAEELQKFSTVCMTVFSNSISFGQTASHDAECSQLHCLGRRDDYKVDIDTYWAQDHFIMQNYYTLRYFDSYKADKYGFVLNYLKGIIDKLEVKEWNIDIDGGNMLHGRILDRDYLLIGPDKRTIEVNKPSPPIPLDTLAREYGLTNERVIRILDDQFDLDRYYNLFYHADMFCTIVGPDPDDKELIFFAQLENYCLNNIDTVDLNNQIKRRATEIKRQLDGDKDIVAIGYLPMYIIHFEENAAAGQNNFILNFNNIIIENYKIGDQIIRRAYIPDYLPVWEKFTKIDKKNNASNGLKAIAGKILRGGNLREEFKTRFTSDASPLEMMRQGMRDFITQKTSEVRELLHQYGIETSEPIPFMQYVLKQTDNPGSIHCLTKVVERDCLPKAIKFIR